MDWKTLIRDLQKAGQSQTSIGEAVGRSQVWVSDVLNGRYKDLKWAEGRALINLHQRLAYVEIPALDDAISEEIGTSTVNQENTPNPEPTPAHHVECCSGDPRHGERRQPDKRSSHDRRENEAT